MFGIDLLDTFGDWLQLGGCIIAMSVLPSSLCAIAKVNGVSASIVNIACGVCTWLLVYDYDILLGLLLGSVVGIRVQNGSIEHYRARLEFIKAQACVDAQNVCFTIGVIMVIKIVLNLFR
jgi:hypothetical protein